MIYVDRQRKDGWCHMWADASDLENLHLMAEAVQLNRRMFQDRKGFPHYDIRPHQRAHAVVLGATETSLKSWLRLQKSRLIIAGGVVSEIVGLLFQLIDVPDERAAEEWQKLKEELVKEIHQVGTTPYSTLLRINMPCGHWLSLKTPNDVRNLPTQDMPCSCGDPTHWFLKFRRVAPSIVRRIAEECSQ